MKKRTKTKTKTQPVVIRNYRDTLFRMLYRNKVRLLSLFNAVNGTHYDNPDDLTITTLEGVLYLGMKNDVSCIIDMMMQLYEHQSTVNPNMPLRNLFYVSDLLQKYIYEEGLDIYSRKQIKIPTPKFVVFYNGDEEQPERKEILLSHGIGCASDQYQQRTERRIESSLQNLAGIRRVYGESTRT